MFDRDTILKDLRTSVVEVMFEKVNGQDRVMRCTLRPESLPASYLSEQNQEKEYHKNNPDLIAVWDVQNNGWRSFHISSVKYVQDVSENYD